MIYFEEEMIALTRQHLRRDLSEITPSDLATTLVSHGKTLLNFSSNNYLGLTNHPVLISAAVTAIKNGGTGGSASRLISGNNPFYPEIEHRLAKFKSTESALVFSSGYMTNLGALQTLVKKGDLIFADRLSHASLIDGARLSEGTFRVYPHKDTEQLAKLLRRRKPQQRGWIITDGIFSMDGDIAPLPELLRLAQEFDASIYLDDAHATGVLGPNGRGTCDHFGISNARIIQMGTLSKALAGLGGFIASDRSVIEYLVNKARPFIYTTALPPALLAASVAALDLVEKEPLLRKRLWDHTRYVREKINQLGFDTGASETPIIPMVIGKTETALAFAQKLMEEGVYLPAIRPPTVPEGTSRLRISLMSTHTDAQIQHLLDAIERIGKELRLI
ncbi:MAG: 8-amino-7-oxononanoate synthase [Candidatus Manganitrophaceae bacterium]